MLGGVVVEGGRSVRCKITSLIRTKVEFGFYLPGHVYVSTMGNTAGTLFGPEVYPPCTDVKSTRRA